MPKQALIALGAGLLSVLATFLPFTGAPLGGFIICLAALPLYLTGFAYGAKAGAIASSAGVLAAALTGDLGAAGFYGLFHAVPAWTVVRQAMVKRAQVLPGQPGPVMDWCSPGFILASLATLAAVLIVTVGTAIVMEGKSFSGMLSANLSLAFEQIPRELLVAEPELLVELIIPVLPAVAGATWMLIAVVNAVFAQSLLARAGKNARPTPAYTQLQLPGWLSWLLVVSAALALIGPPEVEYMARNAAFVLAVPFFFVGLAVVHSVARRRAQSTLILVGFYMVLFLTGWAVLPVAGLGMLEQWAGLSSRFSGPKDGDSPEDS